MNNFGKPLRNWNRSPESASPLRDSRASKPSDYVSYDQSDWVKVTSDQRWFPEQNRRKLDIKTNAEVSKQQVERSSSKEVPSTKHSTGTTETEEYLTLQEMLYRKAETILEQLKKTGLDEYTRDVLEKLLLSEAYSVLTSQSCQGVIAWALDTADLPRERLVGVVVEIMFTYRGDRIEPRRVEHMFRERTELLNAQAFENSWDSHRANQLLHQFQNIELMRALGNFENADQVECWQRARARNVADVTEYGRKLLADRYDPIDVARITRIITAHPRDVLIDDNATH